MPVNSGPDFGPYVFWGYMAATSIFHTIIAACLLYRPWKTGKRSKISCAIGISMAFFYMPLFLVFFFWKPGILNIKKVLFSLLFIAVLAVILLKFKFWWQLVAN